MKTKTFIISALLITTIGTAQTEDKVWNIGAFAGRSEYSGDLGNGFLNFTKASYNFGALSVSRYLNKNFDVSLYASYGEHGFYKNYAERMMARHFNSELTLRYKIPMGAESKLTPFVFAGVGVRNLDANFTSGGSYKVNTGVDPLVPLGIGLDYRLTPAISLRYLSSFGYTFGDERDYVKGGSNDMQLQHNLGVTFSFGGKKDADKDGVADKLDKCPETPSNTPVDADGCTLDKDKDGIADNVDACVDVAGLAKFNGCPDSDNDGIMDSEDTCPQVAGKTEFKGCPDSDSDGIEDAKDKCPAVAGIAQFEGCPDTDGDGIQDAADACPTVKGTVAMNGCADSDGDGIADNKDKCPAVPGIPALNGCPEVKISTKAKEVFQRAMSGIQFETGKDVIKKTSYPVLDNVVSVLKENPDWSVEVQGHTDNVGNYEANKTLSNNRAIAVKNYLVAKGINPDVLKATGYGSDAPIADNKTPAGRAKNRRVEFKITYER